MSERATTLQRLLDEVRLELREARIAAQAAASRVSLLEKHELHLAALCDDDDGSGSSPAAEAGLVRVSGDHGRPVPDNFSARVRAVAREAIAAAGRPLNRSDILEALHRAGVPLPPEDTARRVSKVLSRDERLRNVRGVGYSLVRRGDV